MTRASLSQEVRLALPTDLAQIARFLIRLGGKSFGERFPVGTAEDFYRWKYFGNPLGDAIVGINAAADTVVSVVAATPKHIWPSGKTVLAYELGDFLTDEDYRGMGLFSKLIELVCREAGVGGSSLVYVRPNAVSFPILAGKFSFHEAQRIDARRFGSAEPYLISQDWHSCRPSSSFRHGLASQKTLHPAHPWRCSDRGWSDLEKTPTSSGKQHQQATTLPWCGTAVT